MKPYLQDADCTLYHGDALDVLRELPDESVHCIATSPPFYALRDYGTGRWEGGDPNCSHSVSLGRDGPPKGTAGGEAFRTGQAYTHQKVTGRECLCGATRIDQQIGLESTPEEWAQKLVEVFREARRVLRKDGTLWVECGDSYNAHPGGAGDRGGRSMNALQGDGDGQPQYEKGHGLGRVKTLKPKDLLGTPWLLAFALRADGWWLRGCNIWAKPNAMPESAKDRCTTAHSYVFHFAKSARYFFDGDAISEPAAWERWGDQTVPKYEGTETAAGWIQPKTKHELVARGGRTTNGPRERTSEMRAFDNRLERADGLKHPRSVWTIPTQGWPGAHFATWPEALARRIILAGCPEAVCSVCGEARVRITSRGEESQAPDDVRRKDYERKSSFKVTHAGLGGQKHQDWLDAHPKQTTGYTDCGHDAFVPGTVLDMFAGSGTTLYVARKLGRRGIGIDLSLPYLQMAAKRLAQQSLFAQEAVSGL